MGFLTTLGTTKERQKAPITGTNRSHRNFLAINPTNRQL
jgi:hypothetical protein